MGNRFDLQTNVSVYFQIQYPDTSQKLLSLGIIDHQIIQLCPLSFNPIFCKKKQLRRFLAQQLIFTHNLSSLIALSGDLNVYSSCSTNLCCEQLITSNISRIHFTMQLMLHFQYNKIAKLHCSNNLSKSYYLKTNRLYCQIYIRIKSLIYHITHHLIFT